MLHKNIQFTQSLPPLSLYIHVPWCVRKCPYCDFNSHALPSIGNISSLGQGKEKVLFPLQQERELAKVSPIPSYDQHNEIALVSVQNSLGDEVERNYLQALEQDLISVLPSVWGRSIHSVFIGGGTPSLLSAKAIDSLLMMLRRLLNLAPETEITMEANPGTVEISKFADFATAGITRVSLGIQSFNEDSLRRLGRIHSSTQAKKAIEIAQKSFSRVNIDLMYALPYQTLATCREEIQTALSFGTEHLSLYNLTLEPNTVFAKYPPDGLPDDDLAGDIQDLLIDLTQQAGFEQYEVSAYARHQAYCQHNLNYWQFGDYIGVGPGAHGKISSHNQIMRTARIKNPESWMQKVSTGEHIVESRCLQPSELPFEFMLNALRLKQGVPTHYFEERCGVSLGMMSAMINKAVAKGLLMDDPTRLQATPMGWRYLNDLQEIFLV